jgi:hypothetical protein
MESYILPPIHLYGLSHNLSQGHIFMVSGIKLSTETTLRFNRSKLAYSEYSGPKRGCLLIRNRHKTNKQFTAGKLHSIRRQGDWLKVHFSLFSKGKIFSTPLRPDRFQGPPSLLSNGYRARFPRG